MFAVPGVVTYSSNHSPAMQRIDPSKFMLSKDNRKFSAPAFPVSQQDDRMMHFDEHNLPRSPEITNIPDQTQYNDGIDFTVQ
jgi:hypothetical protein